MQKPKQRKVYFTDDEWEIIQMAANKVARGNKSAFICEHSIKAAKRCLK